MFTTLVESFCSLVQIFYFKLAVSQLKPDEFMFNGIPTRV